MAVPPPSALEGVRVIDLGDEFAAYASRLLVDLGAEVIRVETPDGSPTRRADPLVARPEAKVSAFELFVNAGKRSVALDLENPEGVAGLRELLATADVVIESPAPVLESLGISEAEARRAAPALTRVLVSPFGADQTMPWQPADDLVVMAAGGLLHLGGYPDLGPVVAYGGQSRFAASIFGAVAALVGVLDAELTGEGLTYDVSAQECIAQALEDSAATYALTGRVRERQGDRPREAGSGVYPCADGYVSMIAGRLGTARAWGALVSWLNEVGSPGCERLLRPEWNDFDFRQSEGAIEEFAEIFCAFTASWTKRDLYAEAQARMIALSPVSTVVDVLTDPQLAARGFFVDVEEPGIGTVRFPGPPYRMSVTPVSPAGPAPELGEADVSDMVRVRSKEVAL